METLAPVTIRLAEDADRSAIYRARHAVYAAELGQHPINDTGELNDRLDAYNAYLLVERAGQLLGFVSVTPPVFTSPLVGEVARRRAGEGCGSKSLRARCRKDQAAAPLTRRKRCAFRHPLPQGERDSESDHHTFSIEKYVSLDALPFRVNDRTYEVRLLTVLEPFRGFRGNRPEHAALLLMYAALRYVESRGGTCILVMGRDAVLPLYRKVGLRPTGVTTACGSVRFEILQARVADLRARLDRRPDTLTRVARGVDWALDFPLRARAACFHGGRFFETIGERFDDLNRRHAVVNADVLDAWFPPSPRVIEAIRDHLPWLSRTSPPTGCRGMIDAVAEARGVPAESVLPGAGSSNLIYLALRHWLTAESRALILDPMYGEYAHVLERVIGCDADRLPLSRDNGYELDLNHLRAALRRGYDLVVLVNPNSPTGRHVDRTALADVLRDAPPRTRVWIDETYIEYAGPCQSLERLAAGSRNVVVCKSMSKVYALSGLRAAYLVGPPDVIGPLRTITPPWAVSLPAQVAVVKALDDPAYYATRYRQTHELRRELVAGLRRFDGIEVLPGVANFVLCHLPPDGPMAAPVVDRCRQRGVFLRDAAAMGTRLGTHALRIAVKDRDGNERILAALKECLREESTRPRRSTPAAVV